MVRRRVRSLRATYRSSSRVHQRFDSVGASFVNNEVIMLMFVFGVGLGVGLTISAGVLLNACRTADRTRDAMARAFDRSREGQNDEK